MPNPNNLKNLEKTAVIPLIYIFYRADIFNLPNPSSRSMALISTQPLTEMNTRNLPGVKSGQRVGLTTLPPSVSQISKMWETQPLATLKASTACTGITLPFTVLHRITL
jgi:hypothetical protein